MTDRATPTLSSGPGGREVIMSFSRINLLAIPVAIGVILVAVIPFVLAWGFGRLGDGVVRFFALGSFLPAALIGIVVHEALHGLTWALAGRRPFSSIRFGFHAATLTPYAHFTEPLPAPAYRLGAAMPGVVLGFLPVLLGLATGEGWLTAFGTLFLVAAGGDIIMLWMLRDVDASSSIQDHPSQPGCIVYDSDLPTEGSTG